MKKLTAYSIGFPSIIIIMLFSVSFPFHSCEPDEEKDCDTCLIVYKPNIYLYPTSQSQINIKLSFPLGGKIVTSIPAYEKGWTVDVSSLGIINDKYEYLFYESAQPDVWQKIEGWTVYKPELKTFFEDNMHKYGFNEREIKDFIDYWIPRLIEFDYYEIYPQESNLIETAIKLDIYQKPDNVLRLFYLIKGVASKSNNELKIPGQISQFNRSGFSVTEWGVVLKIN